jgi:hypothetical protein
LARVTHWQLGSAPEHQNTSALQIAMPSLPASSKRSSTDRGEPVRSQSPAPSSCASDDDRQDQEQVDAADAVLADDNWRWLCALLDPVHDAAVRSQGKVFFARLLQTQDGASMATTLAEMEAWRGHLGDDREHELARALFLLGYDKSLALARA